MPMTLGTIQIGGHTITQRGDEVLLDGKVIHPGPIRWWSLTNDNGVVTIVINGEQVWPVLQPRTEDRT